jgi:hypothetical protein
MNTLIVDYIPAGAIPATPRAGIQELLKMLGEAFEVHDRECCTDLTPCSLRISLQTQHRDATASLDRASVRERTPDPEPIRPQGSGQTSRRVGPGPATIPQLELIGRLVKERTPADLTALPARTLAEIQAGDQVSKIRAADLITALLATREQTRTPAGPARISESQIPRTPAVTEDGLYRTPDGQIYKVQVALYGSGRLYAKKLVELAIPRVLKNDKIRTHDFEMEPGAIARLTPAMKMSREEAQAWGRLYGTCCRCGLSLTDDNSIDRGLGKVCFTKF